MKIVIKYSFFLLLFAILGFTREFLFVNINNQLFSVYYSRPDIKVPDSLHYLTQFNYETLYYGKYLLTILYYIAYFTCSYFAVKIICNNKLFTRWIIYIYGLLLLLASITMAYNYLIQHQLNGDEYTFSRWLMGIAQSPLVAFFIIASHKLYSSFQNHSSTK